MESLKFYIKEHKPFIVLYGLCLLLGMILFVCDVYNILNGNIDRIKIKSLLTSILLAPGIIFYGLYCRKFFRAYRDYKKQNKETKILYLNHQSYGNCLDEFNGAYKLFFCSDKPNGKKVCYWLYRKDLMYDDLINRLQYKVIYYEKSKCIHSIEPLYDSFKTEKKIKNSCKRIDYVVENASRGNHREINVGSVCTFFHSLVNFGRFQSDTKQTVTETVTVIGIPVKRQKNTPSTSDFLLKVQAENGKKITLLLNSIEILNLGDLSKRPGYMGYGNFIGQTYKMYYNKYSHIVEFADGPIATNPDQSGDGSMIES